MSVVTGHGLQVAHQCYFSLRPTPLLTLTHEAQKTTLTFKLQRLLEVKEPNTAQSSLSRAEQNNTVTSPLKTATTPALLVCAFTSVAPEDQKGTWTVKGSV